MQIIHMHDLVDFTQMTSFSSTIKSDLEAHLIIIIIKLTLLYRCQVLGQMSVSVCACCLTDNPWHIPYIIIRASCKAL